MINLPDIDAFNDCHEISGGQQPSVGPYNLLGMVNASNSGRCTHLQPNEYSGTCFSPESAAKIKGRDTKKYTRYESILFLFDDSVSEPFDENQRDLML